MGAAAVQHARIISVKQYNSSMLPALRYAFTKHCMPSLLKSFVMVSQVAQGGPMLESVSQPGGAAVQRSVVGAAAPSSHTPTISGPLSLQAVQRGTADTVRALLGDQVSP